MKKTDLRGNEEERIDGRLWSTRCARLFPHFEDELPSEEILQTVTVTVSTTIVRLCRFRKKGQRAPYHVPALAISEHRGNTRCATKRASPLAHKEVNINFDVIVSLRKTMASTDPYA